MKGNFSCRHGDNPTEYAEKLGNLYCSDCNAMHPCLCVPKAHLLGDLIGPEMFGREVNGTWEPYTYRDIHNAGYKINDHGEMEKRDG